MKTKKIRFMVAILPVLFLAAITQAQTTEFTYQGKLTDGANPANGSYDLQFALFDSAGTQIGSPVTRRGTSVSGGIFTVQLDFGVSPFSGANRFLEISVRPAGVGSFTTLSPRQQITSTPYAIRTLSAGTADGLSSACVSCVQDSQINSVAGSKVSGTIPVASVPGGSGNYIQNTSSQQAGSNFNISGNGIIGGNVGIGTAAPGYPLDVNGPVRSLRNTSTDFVAQTTGGTNAWARFSMFTPSQSWAIGSSQNFNGNQFYLHDLTFAQNRFTVQPDGGAISFPFCSVGIGTTAPIRKLHVRGNGFFEDSSFGLPPGRGITIANFSSQGHLFTFDSATSQGYDLLLNAEGGNVGIGINIDAVPARRLHVNGRARIGSIPLEASAAQVLFQFCGRPAAMRRGESEVENQYQSVSLRFGCHSAASSD